MSIRETLNKNKNLSIIIAVVLVAGALALAYFELFPSQQVFHGDEAYYTDDDGATFFLDSMYRAPPFDHNGKQAVRAYVYTDGKGDFVAYMQRYKPEYQKQVQAAIDQAQKDGKPLSSITSVATSDFVFAGTEVKKPGDAKWVDDNSRDAGAVMSPKSRDGSALDQKLP